MPLAARYQAPEYFFWDEFRGNLRRLMRETAHLVKAAKTQQAAFAGLPLEGAHHLVGGQ